MYFLKEWPPLQAERNENRTYMGQWFQVMVHTVIQTVLFFTFNYHVITLLVCRALEEIGRWGIQVKWFGIVISKDCTVDVKHAQ
jgi:hypothetical protein